MAARATRVINRNRSIRNALRFARQYGIKAVWLRTLSARRVYRQVVLLRRSLEPPLEQLVTELPVALTEMSEADVSEIAAMRRRPGVEDIVDRFSRGDVCIGARLETKLVGLVWASTSQAYSSFMHCHLPRREDEVYLYDAYTLEEVRGKRISPLLSNELMARFRDSGYRSAIRATDPLNVTAMSSHAKSGFSPYGVISVIRFGPWQKTLYRSPFRNEGTPGP